MFKKNLKKSEKYFKYFLSSFAVLAVIIITFRFSRLEGANFFWYQNIWNGVATSTIADHPGDQDDWHNFESIDGFSQHIDENGHLTIQGEPEQTWSDTSSADFLEGEFDEERIYISSDHKIRLYKPAGLGAVCSSSEECLYACQDNVCVKEEDVIIP